MLKFFQDYFISQGFLCQVVEIELGPKTAVSKYGQAHDKRYFSATFFAVPHGPVSLRWHTCKNLCGLDDYETVVAELVLNYLKQTQLERCLPKLANPCISFDYVEEQNADT